MFLTPRAMSSLPSQGPLRPKLPEPFPVDNQCVTTGTHEIPNSAESPSQKTKCHVEHPVAKQGTNQEVGRQCANNKVSMPANEAHGHQEDQSDT